MYGRAPKTASGFHALFSTPVGASIPVLARYHRITGLILMAGLWLGITLFMKVRARRNQGIFLDEHVQLFVWLGTLGFMAGLLFVSIACVAF
jgi:hypothetical protein